MLIRKSVIAVLLIFVAAAFATAHGQTFSPRSDTFAFNQSSVITAWNGSDPANPPYPENMGSVNLSFPSSGISIPFELGYLNNGYLQPCDPIMFGPKTWVVGDGNHDGDQYILSGSTNCPYFTGEYGTSGNSDKTFDSFSVVVKYIRHFRRVCQRFRPCQNVPFDTQVSGTGATTQTVIN